MSRYRYLTFDTVTQAFVAEVELAGVSYSWTMACDGEATGSLTLPEQRDPTEYQVLEFSEEDGQPIAVEVDGHHLADPRPAVERRARALEAIDSVAELRRQLVIERDGRPIWAGMIWATPGLDVLDVKAAEFGTYLRRRINNTRQVFTNVDSWVAVRQILATAATATNGNVGITPGSGSSGTLITKTYEPWEYGNVGRIIEDLAAADDGFEYSIVPTYGANFLSKLFRFELRRGRDYATTGFVFEVGRNVDADTFTWPSDATSTAFRLFGTGAGSGAAQKHYTATSTALLAAGYPMLEDVVSFNDETATSRVGARTRGALTARAKPIVLPELSIDPDGDPGIGAFDVGDGALLRIPPDRIARHPDGLSFPVRIHSVTVEVANNGTEAAKVTLVEEV